ncbi:NnrS family protein [Nitrosomonas sp. JL21]|uniref:NnrS family protein n=1 Tax=Nitrosomonas sp. JL21 TaxID=153949 RepID=UPI00136838EE|nr:NnrS family protein [Nitrosomonas sp. JL21]MBL8496744.1 NnrS family protein [Nitrosomonas sp.]MXS76517.1 NnrS family protein [Nitrosomonas sp. JL21]
MDNQLTVWDHMSAAPHRSLFLAGALQGVLTVMWWVFDLTGRYGIAGTMTNWSVPPTWAHAFLMIYGFFPFFIFGFLFTTYPNWMNGDKVRPREYVMTCVAMAAGVALFYAGLLTHKAISIAGVELMLAGWSVAVYVLFRILLTTPAQDKRHARVISVALLMGWLGVAAYLVWLVTDSPAVLNFARHAGIWFFLLPIVLTVSHRMIPFFSSRVLDNYEMVRPFWMLWLMLAGIAVHGSLQWLELPGYLWIVDLPLAACAGYLSYRWGFQRSFQVSLLAVLHVSFAWLGVAMALYGLQSLIYFASGTLLLGLAPLHAIGIGFFSGMILAMASRVTIGHSGRPLELDRFTWLLFLGFQATAVLRILADIVPAGAPLFYVTAGLVWLAYFGLWAGKFAPIYWRARVDGKAG